MIFPEVEYVLQGIYQASREEILQAFRFLISLPNVKTSSVIKQAVTIYESTSLDMADCIIVAYSFGEKLASFDDKLLKTAGVVSYWQGKIQVSGNLSGSISAKAWGTV